MAADIQKRTGPRGTVWTVLVDLPRNPATGKRRQKRITADTKRHLENERAKLLASIANGGFAEADAGKLTVEQYMVRWLESMAQTLRHRSHRRYTEMARLHAN